MNFQKSEMVLLNGISKEELAKLLADLLIMTVKSKELF